MSQVSCPICDSSDWKNVDEFRYKASGMSLCVKCGFITYPDVISKSSDLKEFYREEYRDVPSVANVYAGQRKMHYHGQFLIPVLDEWKKAGRKGIAVAEIGAAFGMFLDWIKKYIPGTEVYGTELTLSFRRNAWHEFGINLTEELDTSIKYDLITSYKVAEHQPFIDKELRKYVECLKEDGLMYISVPTWFGPLNNFGTNGFSIEYYFHKNHINVWTRKLFETLLKKVGLEIVKENHQYYDDTYLCKRNDALMSETPVYEDPAEIIKHLSNVKKAAIAIDEGRFSEALQAWPNFPYAYQGLYESNRAQFHKEGWDWIKANVLDKATRDCPDSADVCLFCADISMRYSKWPIAIEYLNKSLEYRPQNPPAFMNLGSCFRALADAATDPKDKLRMLSEARAVMRHLKQVSLQNFGEAQTWIMNDNAKLPMPHESKTAATVTDLKQVAVGGT